MRLDDRPFATARPPPPRPPTRAPARGHVPLSSSFDRRTVWCAPPELGDRAGDRNAARMRRPRRGAEVSGCLYLHEQSSFSKFSDELWERILTLKRYVTRPATPVALALRSGIWQNAAIGREWDTASYICLYVGPKPRRVRAAARVARAGREARAALGPRPEVSVHSD
ncbi:hypothetical protein EVAR_65790_1 [Eumeta japonica]|uniref:Uncharacterized protein n=1 Tax=Eumeta variegata TaxID=151549 RepID=A0A4C2A3V2_EUMVA|nr:hypothetical protein EVAR_65790_1 [Eumeta japonica]